jgi:hypothetical protein
MARGPLTFKERDLKAAVNAIKKAGENVTRVKIEKDGSIVIDVADTNIVAGRKPSRRNNPLDAL